MAEKIFYCPVADIFQKENPDFFLGIAGGVSGCHIVANITQTERRLINVWGKVECQS